MIKHNVGLIAKHICDYRKVNSHERKEKHFFLDWTKPFIGRNLARERVDSGVKIYRKIEILSHKYIHSQISHRLPFQYLE